MYRRTAAAVVTGVALVVGGVSACSSGDGRNGVEKKTPQEVLDSAKAALKSAKSVHVAGTSTTGDAGAAPLSVDIRYVGGRGSVGKLSQGARSVDLVRVGSDIYVRGAGDLVGVATTGTGDRYLKVSASQNFGLAELTDLGSFADTTLKPTGKLAPTVEETTVGDAKAVVLTDTDPTEGGKLYVANTGSPHPLQIVGAGPDAGHKVTFSEYDADVPLSAPANALSGPLLNGEEKKTGAQVVDDARAALKTAQTVHIHGHTPGGADTGDGQIDMRYVNGRGAAGTIVAGGKKAELVRIGTSLYFRGGADLFGAQAAAVIGNRYVKTSTSNPDAKDMAGFTELTKFADETFLNEPANGIEPGVTRGTLDGRPVVLVTEKTSDGSEQLSVADTGSPYPLKVASITGSQGEVLFTEYDQPMTLTAPTNVVYLPEKSPS